MADTATRTEPTLFTLGQLAERLDVPTHRLKYAIETNRIKPRFRVGITRVWVEEDLPGIRSALARVASNGKGKTLLSCR